MEIQYELRDKKNPFFKEHLTSLRRTRNTKTNPEKLVSVMPKENCFRERKVTQME